MSYISDGNTVQAKIMEIFTPWDDPKLVECVNLQIQGVFLTGSPPKSSKYKKVNLDEVRCI